MDRTDALRALLKADPANHFARYGLAQELVKQGEDELAVGEFQHILAQNADYQAAYYHAGKALERLRRPGEARTMYQQGIEASFRTGNSHARSELEAALVDLADRITIGPQ